MSEIELTPPAAKPAKAKAEAKVEAQAPATWSKFLRSANGFSYADPTTGIRYEPNTPVRVDGEPKVGSWLDCQMKAGYIIEA